MSREDSSVFFKHANQYRTLGARLAILGRMDRNFFKECLKKYSIGMNDMAVMFQLDIFKELRHDEVSSQLAMDQPTLSKIVKRLYTHDYVYTQRSATDGRACYLSLTQKGLDLIPILLEHANDWMQLISQGLTEEELRLFNNILERMLENGAAYAFPYNRKIKSPPSNLYQK